MTDSILFHCTENRAYLTLNNPARHNALGRQQLDAISSILTDVESSSEVRVLVVRGAGEKTFCAGAALDELGAGALSDDAFQRMTAQLAALSVPTVCAMKGNVFGGGAELAASCDFRIGVEGMRMRVPAATFGLCYPVEGMCRFVESFGASVTKRILMAAEEFDTAGLLQIGFLDRAIPATALEGVTDDFAQHIASLAPLAVQSMKAILRQMARGDSSPQGAEKMVATCLQSRDLQEGLGAQREKRKPVFEGR